MTAEIGSPAGESVEAGCDWMGPEMAPVAGSSR